LIITVFGSEFQTIGAENRKTRLENSVFSMHGERLDQQRDGRWT